MEKVCKNCKGKGKVPTRPNKNTKLHTCYYCKGKGRINAPTFINDKRWALDIKINFDRGFTDGI